MSRAVGSENYILFVRDTQELGRQDSRFLNNPLHCHGHAVAGPTRISPFSRRKLSIV